MASSGAIRIRFRPRLALAFVLVAGAAAGLLALGSFLLVRESRMRAAEERALAQARFNLVLAERELPTVPSAGDIEELLDLYRSRESLDAVVVAGGQAYVSDPSVSLRDVPVEAREAGGGEPAHAWTVVDGVPSLVVGAEGRSGLRFYFVVPQRRIAEDLAQLRAVLMGGWLAVVALAALVGAALARRTLRPVARASEAARAMAGGRLHTRLPEQRRDEFGAWAASFNRMAEALEHKVAALMAANRREQQLTADVAHELRTPLSAIASEVSVLQRHLDEMPPAARRPTELLVADVERFRRLVEELLEMSRLEAGEEPVLAGPTELGMVVSDVLATRGWDSSVTVDREPVAVTTDPRRLERILSNLVGNALEHGGGDVRVTLGTDDGRAVVEVADRGPGIPAEHVSRVFDRFYKADPSRSAGGSGLGLAIARENARLLGGDISVESRPGRGTRFTLVLPA